MPGAYPGGLSAPGSVEMTPEEYAERQERRRERLENAADRARAEAESRFATARRIGDGIPFGQPVLVDHYSAKYHRRDLARIDTNMRKGVEAYKAAESYESRAALVETAGVSSDNPDATEILRGQVAELEPLEIVVRPQTNSFRSRGGRTD